MITSEAFNNRVQLIDKNKVLLSVKQDDVITLNDSITIIGESFMRNDQTIEGIILSDSIETIEEYAFYDCKNLKFVIIRKGIHSIGQCAFSHNSALKYVIYQGTKDEYLKIWKGEPFETIGIIHCIDGVVQTVNYKKQY